jgi:transcriptional regulator with XRE-family HTH domain
VEAEVMTIKRNGMDLGKKLKLLRGNMTQAELSKLSGVDKAIVSKIEAGKMPGTIESHKKLADVFGLKLSEFYAFLEEEKPEQIEFHPGNHKTDVYQNFLEILTTIPLAKKMLPTFITLRQNEEKSLEETIKDVERFIIILNGEIEIENEGKIYRLKKELSKPEGDSLYSKSPKKHRIKNTGNSVAHVVCVSSPPVL